MTTLEQRCIVAFLILLSTEYSVECGSQFSFQILHPRHRQVLEQQRHETSTYPSSSSSSATKSSSSPVTTSETTTTTTVTTTKVTTTSTVFTTTLSSTTSKEPETFPCDNFICLLQNFELMKTNNGYLVRKLQKSESSENCVHFKCWLNKFRLTKTKFGFEFIDKKLQNLPTFSNDNDFSIFQSHTEDSSTYDQVVFPRSSTHQENMETSTVIPTLTEHSDLSEAALDDFFENYDYEEYDE